MSSIGKDKKEKKMKKAKREPEQSPVSMKVDKKSKKESKKRKALDMDVDAGDKENMSEPLNNAEPKSVLETRKTKKKKKKKSKKVNKAEEQEETKQNGEEVVPMTKKKSKKAKVEKGAIEEEKNVEKEKPIAVLKAKLKEIKSLSPIQAKTVDTILDGFDLMAHAATDQYKTLAFVLPILESLHGSSEQSTKKGAPSAIVLLPTKDLATQEFGSYGGSLGLVSRCVSGGSSHIAQARKLRGRVDIIVGTPGRVKDQIENGIIDLSSVKFRVLAEADQLSKTWLVEHVEFILGKMKDVTNIQTLLFSTNMPRWVELIAPSRYLKSSYKKVVLPGNEKKISQSNGGFTNRRDDTFSNKGGQVAATMATDGES